MATATCQDCGKIWTARAPAVCSDCGHNVAADVAAEVRALELVEKVSCGDCRAEFLTGAPPICPECGHNIASDSRPEYVGPPEPNPADLPPELSPVTPDYGLTNDF